MSDQQAGGPETQEQAAEVANVETTAGAEATEAKTESQPVAEPTKEEEKPEPTNPEVLKPEPVEAKPEPQETKPAPAETKPQETKAVKKETKPEPEETKAKSEPQETKPAESQPQETKVVKKETKPEPQETKAKPEPQGTKPEKREAPVEEAPTQKSKAKVVDTEHDKKKEVVRVRESKPRTEVTKGKKVIPEVDVLDDDAAEAAKYAALVTKNHRLEDQIEQLEDKLFDAEEEVMSLQRKLVLSEEEITDVQALLQLRETHNDEDRRELADRLNRLDEEITRLNDLDSERRKFDSHITVLEAEVEQSNHVNQKIEVALSEMEAGRKTVAELMSKNGDLLTVRALFKLADDGKVTERQSRELIDIEKKFSNEVARQHHIHAKSVGELEKLVTAERKRAQEALDYVRATLKARIQGLELQLKEMETGTESRRLKRKMERELMQANRAFDEGKEFANRNALQLESLDKQLELVKQRGEKLQSEILQLETQEHDLKREALTLQGQLDAALQVNAKLNAAVPLDVRVAIEEEAASNFSSSKA